MTTASKFAVPCPGKLEIICGPMFSGKSEELIKRLRRAKVAQKQIATFKHSFDTERTNTEQITSHNGNIIDAISISNSQDIFKYVTPATQVVGIDEIQFFSKDIISVVMELLNAKKHVILAGLNLDFRSIPFAPMPTLIAIADEIVKLTAVCNDCGNDAYFSQRMINGTPAPFDSPVVLVGAREQYEARCRNCFVTNQAAVWQSLR